MDRESYRAYLMSEDWKERRKEFFEEAGFECEECGERAAVIHHLNYILKIFDEANKIPYYKYTA